MKVIKVIWGNSLDNSLSGLILAENDDGRRYWYLGSRVNCATEQEDIDYILNWGQKYPLEYFSKVLEEKHETI